MNDELLPQDLSDMPTPDLCNLLLACGMSNDPSDRMFVRACRDELTKRKPKQPLHYNVGIEPPKVGSNELVSQSRKTGD